MREPHWKGFNSWRNIQSCLFLKPKFVTERGAECMYSVFWQKYCEDVGGKGARLAGLGVPRVSMAALWWPFLFMAMRGLLPAQICCLPSAAAATDPQSLLAVVSALGDWTELILASEHFCCYCSSVWLWMVGCKDASELFLFKPVHANSKANMMGGGQREGQWATKGKKRERRGGKRADIDRTMEPAGS